MLAKEIYPTTQKYFFRLKKTIKEWKSSSAESIPTTGVANGFYVL